MTVVWQSLVKLGVTVYLLFGCYTLFIGFLEKNRKKKIIGTLVLVVPTIVIAVILKLLYDKYGA